MEDQFVLALQKADITDRKQALSYLADSLYKRGDVKESFSEAILDREEHFATGLAINGIGVAIPHTDNQHVIHSKIAVMTLKEPVEFLQMGSLTETVPVKVIFMLALEDAHGHLEMLSKLMEFFQDQKAVKELLAIEATEDGKEELKHLLISHGIFL